MKISYSLFIVISLFIVSCGDSIPIGADLLDDGSIEVKYTDTLKLTAQTIPSDPPPTFRNSSSFNGRTYLIGEINDPVFGTYASETYFSVSTLAGIPDFSGAEFDSVILSLPLDTLGLYGDATETHNLELYQLLETFEVDPGDTLFADMSLPYETMALSSISSVIDFDSVNVYNPTSDTVLQITPQIRMPMDTAFWSPVFRDTSINSTSEALLDYIKGFALVSASADNSMFGINLSQDSPATVEVYYTLGDTAKRVYFLDIGSFRHSYFTHDFTGTPVEEALGGNSVDKKLYLQSMSGPNVSFDLSSINLIPGEIINKAVLEIFVEEPQGSYPPVAQILASYKRPSGLRVIEDILAFSSNVNFIFGGGLETISENGELVRKYEINITNHINNIINGEVTSYELIITAIQKAERPNRSVLYGPEHPEFPAVLKIISTKP